MKNVLTFLVLFMSLSVLAFAKDFYEVDGKKLKLEKIFEGEEVIWGMDFLSKDELLFSERSGKLKLLNLTTKKVTDLAGVPKVFAKDQGGLLDVAVDTDKTIYFSYSEPTENGATTSLFKGKLNPDKTKIEGTRIFQAKAFEKGGAHFGSRIVLDPAGYLFLSVGERNKRDQAQKLDNHQGKILRLTKEGKPAAGNPFLDNKNALPEIWSYGHRNPQGLAMDKDGQLYNAEFGPRGGDEINLVSKGLNYGWPEITYGREYWGPKIGSTKKEGMEQPFTYWVPSINPSGMTIYQSDVIAPFKGNMLLACLDNHIRRLVFSDKKIIKEEKLIDDLSERFRHIKTGPDGFVYISTDSGKIFRLQPAK